MVFQWSLSESKSSQFSGNLSVYRPISKMLYFWWSPLDLLFPSPPVPELIFGDCTERANYNWYRQHFIIIIIIIIIIPFRDFHQPELADSLSLKFEWQQSPSSLQDSSQYFINPLVTVPRAPIMIGINVTFKFHSFFSSLVRSRYLSFFSLSFNFTLWSAGTAKSTILQILFFCWLLLVLVVWPGLSDPFVWQNPRGVLCVSFSRTEFGLCTYHVFI